MRSQDNATPPRSTTPDERSDPEQPSSRRLALRVLAAFALTFIVARVVVLLIMLRTIPDLFLYVGATHVHHLNYGIFLLSGVGAYLIFRRPVGNRLMTTSTLYGIGLALTFDEFGMWLHLGGGYWQRTSFDAVTVIASLLGLIAFAPSLKRFRPRHWAITAILIISVAVFATMLIRSLRYAERKMEPHLKQLDERTPQ